MTVDSEAEDVMKMVRKKERTFLVFEYDKQHGSEKVLNTFDWGQPSQEHRHRVHCVMIPEKIIYISTRHAKSAVVFNALEQHSSFIGLHRPKTHKLLQWLNDEPLMAQVTISYASRIKLNYIRGSARFFP